MEEKFSRRVDMVIFVSRALPLFPLGLISAAAGVLRLPLGAFVVWTFAGALVRCLMLGYMGFFTRSTYLAAGQRIDAAQAALTVVGVLAAAWLVHWLRSRAAGRAR
jgi:uncharacterized membrane protein YdjX (TVP38/TMEM64 family)